MITIQQFLDERGGKLLPADMLYLMRLGLESLMPSAPELSGLASLPTTDVEAKKVGPEIHQHELFGCSVGYLSMALPENLANAIYDGVGGASGVLMEELGGVAPRTFVVGSRFGEEVLSVCAAQKRQGQNVQTVYVPIPGDTVWQDEFKIFCENVNRAPLSAYLGETHVMPAWDFAAMVDKQDIQVLVICFPTEADEIDCWMRHMLPNGFVMIVGNNSLARQFFGESVQVHPVLDCAMVSMKVLEAANNPEEPVAEVDAEVAAIEPKPNIPNTTNTEPQKSSKRKKGASDGHKEKGRPVNFS